MKDLEENIENKEDYEYIKGQISNLFMMFFNELDEMKGMYEKKIDAILDRQSKFDEKISRIENAVNNIQKDIYMEDMNEFEIICPYCDHEFVVELNEIKDEVICPKCNNAIELDWNDCGLDCGGECSECQEHNDYDEDDDM